MKAHEYDVYYEEHIRNIVHTPFQTPLWARFQTEYFGDVFHFLSIENGGVMKAGLAIFELTAPEGKLFYTYGRYGTAGLVLNHADIKEALELFTGKIVADIAPSTLAISIGTSADAVLAIPFESPRAFLNASPIAIPTSSLRWWLSTC